MFDPHDLAVRIRAGTPLLLIETNEEALLLDAFRHVVAELLRPLWRWSITGGLARLDIDDPFVPAANDSSAVLDTMRRDTRRGIWLLLDFAPYLRYAMNVRMLREVVLGQGAAKQTVVLIGAKIELPPELEPLATRFQMRLPDDAALAKLLREEAFAYSREHGGRRVDIDAASQRAVLRHLRGLALLDARRIVRELIHNDGLIGPDDVPRVQRAKFELLGRGGVMSLEPDIAQMDQIAGLTHLKRWIAQRRAVFIADSPPKGLDPPRGVLLLGVQGTGKSLAAKACAGGFGVPLLRLDFGALYNKYHGETERNLRQALATAEAMAPCVVWCDEIEKGLATSDSDGGVSRRVLGTLLTWMSERRAPVFLVATANDVSRLPPEFLRKGRFDEIFFVDLPQTDARRDAFSIHLTRREQDTAHFDLEKLAAASEGFSGAEIEQAIVSALYDAFADNARLNTTRILDALTRTRPLSVVMAEQVQALRDWARERCVAAG
ncbi:MAG: AAA family ATPase [Gammaproteobacteria bacterium]|nr:AAA family ATPase [Gammaproteobacteria bacterium]